MPTLLITRPRYEITTVINKTKPELIVLNGHGDADLITGQDNEILIKTGENEGLLTGKIIYALSCRTAKILGPKSIEKKTKCYLGYTEDFVFFCHREFFSPSLALGYAVFKLSW